MPATGERLKAGTGRELAKVAGTVDEVLADTGA
jgi:hypothetical protein